MHAQSILWSAGGHKDDAFSRTDLVLVALIRHHRHSLFPDCCKSLRPRDGYATDNLIIANRNRELDSFFSAIDPSNRVPDKWNRGVLWACPTGSSDQCPHGKSDPA